MIGQALLRCFAPLCVAWPAALVAAQDTALSPVPGSDSRPRDPLLSAKYELRDPAHDAPWATEVANEIAGKQLSALGELIGESANHSAPIKAADLAAIAGAEVACTNLRPRDLAQVFASPVAEVWRSSSNESGPAASGLDSLSKALAALTQPFDGGRDVHAKFKIVEVLPSSETTFETVAYLMLDGRSKDRALQVNATWRCRWTRTDASKPPLLGGVEVTAFEENRGRAGRETLFQDVTASAFGDCEAWTKQLTKGLDQWAGELDGSLGGAIVGHEGFALGDVDGDGLDDVYVCQSGGLPNRMFRHLPDGRLEDVSAAWGVDFLDQSRSALILDLDNDGDEDLAIAIDPWIVVLENRGAGANPRFAPVARVPGVSVTSIAAADIDRDGDLDLYACGYTLPDRLETTPVPYYDANNGRPNILYRNDGKFVFVDATRELGLDENNRRFSFAASFEDFDNDGDQDLYVANDFGRNNLYRNDGGKFHDIAAQAGVEDIAAGMGVTWADFDGDGLIDLYVSNMFSSAGERVTYQRNFRPELDEATRALFQRHARGNSLFKNQGDGTFRDVSIESGTTMGRWAWGSKFVDFDNDGRPDIFVPNGFVTGEDPADL